MPEIIPFQHSPPARQRRSQARAQAVLTPTPRAPLYGTPAVPQLRPKLDRGSILEGAAPSIQEGRGPKRSSGGEDGEVEEENSGEEEYSDGSQGAPATLGAYQGTGGPTLAQSNQPVSNQSESSLLAIMHQMPQIMATFKSPSMKVSQPRIITPLNGCCSNYILTQVRANLPYHIIYGQLPPSSALFPLGHIQPSLAFLANSPPHQPASHYCCFGPGAPFNPSGAYGSSSHHQALGQPVILVGFWPKWPFLAI
ncbi:hypothetical protein O181_006130 [Austropuccinia psidii MF-1]|uniref:Uncharacterized protein n=1 Tax=Austropuccinia psidii MF-1 TaxID=1389203 RepID=A0A9Q3BJR9_9BASI|nr:hypothetical protein [Austropuccinia psidii MF-1]